MTETLQPIPPGSERSEIGSIVDEYWVGNITYNEYAIALQQEVRRRIGILEAFEPNQQHLDINTRVRTESANDASH